MIAVRKYIAQAVRHGLRNVTACDIWQYGLSRLWEDPLLIRTLIYSLCDVSHLISVLAT